MLRELAIDDGDARLFRRVEAREIAPLEHRNPHRLEVAGRERVHERLLIFAVRRLVTLDPHAAVPFIPRQDRDRRGRGCRDAWRRAQPLEQLLVEGAGPRLVVAAERRRDLERDQVVHRDAGFGALQVLQAAHEEAGAEQQQEAERDLCGDEPLAEEERAAGARHRAGGVLQRDPRIGAARAECREQTEDHAGRDRERHRERENPQIRCRIDEQRLTLGRHQREERLGQRNRQPHAERAAGNREHEAFGQELPNQLAAASAERQPHRDLALPHDAARDQQVRDVGAGDQQHEPDHAHQDDERRREFVAEARVADRRAFDAQLTLHELLARVLRPVLRAGQRHLVLRESA